MLNAIRLGNLDQDTIALFSKLSRPVKYEDGPEPVQLYVFNWMSDLWLEDSTIDSSTQLSDS